MDAPVAFAIEMNEWAWKRLTATLKDVTPQEAEWRPVPESNNINLIVRHLVVEAQWQSDAMRDGKPMPAEVSAEDQQLIDSLPLDDFDGNFKKLEESCEAFIEALRLTTLSGLEHKGQTAYQEYRAAGVRPEVGRLRQAAQFRSFAGSDHASEHSRRQASVHRRSREARVQRLAAVGPRAGRGRWHCLTANDREEWNGNADTAGES